MAIVSVTGFAEPFVQTHPFFDKGFVAVYQRTANNGAGTGSSTVSQVVTQFRLSQLTDFSFPFRNGGRFYLGLAVVQRTATGSGIGTATAIGLRSKSSEATGSGTGSQTTTSLRIPVRTATGNGIGNSSSETIRGLFRSATNSGTGTATSTQLLTIIRNGASSAGTGSSSVSQVLTNIRTATGSGTSSSSTVFLHVVIRISTGSGEGTSAAQSFLTVIRTATDGATGTSDAVGARIFLRQGTGSGTGSDTLAQWMKSHIFRVPASNKVSYARRLYEGAPDALFAHTPKGPRAKNLYRLADGSYTTTDPRRPELITRTYLGGHDNFLTDEEILELTNAGYGSYIT